MSTLSGGVLQNKVPKTSSTMDASGDDLAKSASNLLLTFRLVVRCLLECVMTSSKNRSPPPDSQQLIDLFVMLEQVFHHGLKAKNGGLLGLWSSHDELWRLIEAFSKQDESFVESVTCIRQLPTVHKSIGKVRAWFRLVVMQKKLSDNMLALIRQQSLLKDFYEPWALLRQETLAEVFAGSLIGLRVLECNLYLKEEDLIKQPNEVDLSIYVTIPTVPVEQDNEAFLNGDVDAVRSTDDEKERRTLLDQCDFLEERNRFLSNRVDALKNQLQLLKDMRKHNSASDNISADSAADTGSIGSAENLNGSNGGGSSGNSAVLFQLEQMETAMASMEKDVHEKQDTIVLLRSQIDDVKRINLDLYQKLRGAEEANRGKDKLISTLETERDNAVVRYTGVERRLSEAETASKKNETFTDTLQLELRKKTEFCAQLQTELVDLQNHTQSLKEARDAEMVLKDQLAVKLASLKPMEEDFTKLKAEHATALKKVNDYEVTLSEMGSHLEETKLKADDLKENMVLLADAQWESDKQTTECRQCQKPFSVGRRKHHCRNCGMIFCGECSENTMPLPSSAKPVRVCDECYALLLNRYSAKNTALAS